MLTVNFKGMNNADKLIISIYDYTTAWVQPYIQAGYAVICWDKEIEGCILAGFTRLMIQIDEAIAAGYTVYGILAAPPCTDFAASGAWTWPSKDKPAPGFLPFISSTEKSEALARLVLHLVDLYQPLFWSLENPVGRIAAIIPELKPYKALTWQPYEFGDGYSKKTILYGQFFTDLPKTVVPITDPNKILNTPGGKNQKRLRSATPAGFAKAFFTANQ